MEKKNIMESIEASINNRKFEVCYHMHESKELVVRRINLTEPTDIPEEVVREFASFLFRGDVGTSERFFGNYTINGKLKIFTGIILRTE